MSGVMLHQPKKTGIIAWLGQHVFTDIFELVYIAISIATFTHTTWAAATTFEGTQPPYNTDPIGHIMWWIAGALLAIAVDVGMFLSARELSKRRSLAMTFAFLIAAVASFYTQVLYAFHHTQAMDAGQGVNTYWISSLLPFVDARVIIVPLMLPLFAAVYTIARIQLSHQRKQDEILTREADLKIETPEAEPIQPEIQLEVSVAPALPEETIEDEVPEPTIPSIENLPEEKKALTFIYNDKVYGPYADEDSLKRGYRRVKRKSPAIQEVPAGGRSNHKVKAKELA